MDSVFWEEEFTEHHKPRLDIIREASASTSSASYVPPDICGTPMTAERDDIGGPYTLGKDGAVADVGLELPPLSPVDVVGESGGRPEEDSVIRDSE